MKQKGTSFETKWRLVWCYLRNLVHTTYREVRHVGLSWDPDAKLRLPDSHRFAAAAKRCSKKRILLKGTSLFKQTLTAESVEDLVQPYRGVTGLELADLVLLFREEGWAKRYGGHKWERIAGITCELAEAINAGDLEFALELCTIIKNVEHNSGLLVPTPKDWQRLPYLREKWPELCG